MLSKIHLSVIIALTAVIWGTALWINGIPVTKEMIYVFGTVTAVVGGLLFIFDRWIWHLKILHPWFVAVPDLSGTWKAKIQSTWIDPKTNQGIPPIEAFLVIRQTYSSLSIRLMTPESSSECCAAKILRADDGIYQAVCIYRNEPKHEVRHRSEVHYGGMRLHVSERYPKTMRADYWTDRKTTGDIQLSERSEKLYGSFVEATTEMNSRKRKH